MAHVLLITKDDIIATCIGQSASYDKAKIKDSAIQAAQYDYMRPVIGDDLYDEIIAQKAANTLTALNTSLINQFKDALAWYTLLIHGPLIYLDITTKGLQLNNSEFSSGATNKDRADIMDSLKRLGDSYKNAFVRWIEAEVPASEVATYTGIYRSDSFPLYENGDDDGVTNPIIGGMILDTDEDCTNDYNE